MLIKMLLVLKRKVTKISMLSKINLFIRNSQERGLHYQE
jgi:hypothetical protein